MFIPQVYALALLMFYRIGAMLQSQTGLGLNQFNHLFLWSSYSNSESSHKPSIMITPAWLKS